MTLHPQDCALMANPSKEKNDLGEVGGPISSRKQENLDIEEISARKAQSVFETAPGTAGKGGDSVDPSLSQKHDQPQLQTPSDEIIPSIKALPSTTTATDQASEGSNAAKEAEDSLVCVRTIPFETTVQNVVDFFAGYSV